MNLRYPYREVTWNFNQGVAVVDLTLGSKTYAVQMATPQLFLLLQFNTQPVLTAIELATKMGISISKLGAILMTFTRSRILKRDPTADASDPEMKITLNHDFVYDKPSFTIVKLMNTPEKKKIQEEEIMEKFTMNREIVLQARIVKEMKLSKHLTYGDLFNRVKVSIPFPMDETKFSEILKKCESEQYVTKNNDGSYDFIEDDD